jgi:DMSO/TMAO reductase YedYZ molybdopterin-dependent catalytic subunit
VRSRRRSLHGLNARQVNLLLEIAVFGAFATGLLSWAVGTGWSRWWTAAHAVCGLSLLVLMPAKLRGSVRGGMRRGNWSRWLSVTFGVMVLATVVLGLLHSTGAWHGVGYWSALWTHFLLAFALFPIFVWHLASRPVRPKRVDLDRRALLGVGVVAGVAATGVLVVETALRGIGAAGRNRRFTGSHEVASFDPDAMPVVSWIDDRAPDIDESEWRLRVAGTDVAIDAVRSACRPLVAGLDCTGGWWSEQRWDVVPVRELLGDRGERSFRVVSATGYTRVFPMGDADVTYLAGGYDGRPLRRGHGAPVRIVAPGRRGPWWVKWVVSIEPTDQPAWLQLPFPAT